MKKLITLLFLLSFSVYVFADSSIITPPAEWESLDGTIDKRPRKIRVTNGVIVDEGSNTIRLDITPVTLDATSITSDTGVPLSFFPTTGDIKATLTTADYTTDGYLRAIDFAKITDEILALTNDSIWVHDTTRVYLRDGFSGLDVSIDSLSVDNTILAGANKDISHVLGRWKMGYEPTFGADGAILGHFDMFNPTNWAIAQDNNGDTWLNSGRYTYLNSQGNYYARLYTSGTDNMFHIIAPTVLAIGGALGSEAVEITQSGTNPTILNIDTDYSNLTLRVPGTISCDNLSVDSNLMIGGNYVFPTTAPTVAGSVISFDATTGALKWGPIYVAPGAGGVASVNEGTASPLEISPTTGVVNITIASADASTSGYISATNYTNWQNNRVSTDANLATLEINDAYFLPTTDGILGDVQQTSGGGILTWTSRLTIVSSDINAFTGPLLNVTTDVAVLYAGQLSQDANIITNINNIATQTTRIDIISSDINAYTGPLSVITADISNLYTGQFSQDANIITNANNISTQTVRINIISSDLNAYTGPISIITADISNLYSGQFSQDANTITNATNITTQTTRINIVSSDLSAYTGPLGYVTSDVSVLKVAVGVLSSDASWANNGSNTIHLKKGLTAYAVSIDGNLNVGNTVSCDVLSQAEQATFQFTITDPENIPTYTGRDDKAAPIWENRSGKTFTVGRIEAWSDTDNYSFQLTISGSGTDFTHASQTTMDVVSCDTDGTEVYTDTIISGFDDATVADKQVVLFAHNEGAANVVKCNVYGKF